MSKLRLDELLVSKGLVETKNKAYRLVMAGEVTVNGKIATKAGNQVSEDSVIEIAQKPAYVSRGGIKLDYALNQFHLDVSALAAVDIGASTGGFTDCLLQKGANRVYAVDVGRRQLDYKLIQNPRVNILDKTNVHYPFSLPEKVDLATIDVSFISLIKVVPNVIQHLKPCGYLIVLLKPQFEAEKQEVGKGGIIKDPLIHARVIGRFIIWAIENRLRLRGLVESPITGAEGNREFLVWLSQY